MVRQTALFTFAKLSDHFSSRLIPYSHFRFLHSRVKISLTCCCWLACLWLLAACGPESGGGSDQQLIDATHQIALDFQASNNLDEARSRLGQLKVANPTQWLVYVAESSIAENGESNGTTALVKLATKLDLQTAEITRYATIYNLLPAPTPPPPPANVVLSQPVAPLTATTGNATSSQPGVAAVAPKMPVSSSLVVTLTTASSPAVASVPLSTVLTVTNLAATGITTAVDPKPVAKAKDAINVRGGPGVNYGLVGALQGGESVPIVGKNLAGDWWEVTLTTGQRGWVYSQLVEPGGDTASVVIAANIPEPPPPPTAAPVVQAPAAQPTPAPTTPAANPSDTPHFTLVSKRMWSKAENGDCRGQHLLRLHVLDANDVRLNGVTLQGIYTGEKIVTGSQGKGDGIIEYDLYNSGEAFKVITNNDGRPATSDNAEGFTTRSLDIDEATLIAGGYCSNHEDCQVFYSSYGCQGHHSWEATLKRNY